MLCLLNGQKDLVMFYMWGLKDNGWVSEFMVNDGTIPREREEWVRGFRGRNREYYLEH